MMKKNLSLITLLWMCLLFPQTLFSMLTPPKLLKPRASQPITTKIPTSTRPRIPTKKESYTEVPRTTPEGSSVLKTTSPSYHTLPEEYKSPDFTSEQQAQFEELEKTTKPKFATVIPKTETETEKMFFNNILKAHAQGKALGFISDKAAKEINQLGPEYKELFENETNVIKDSNGHPIFKSQKVDLGYEFALPTTHTKATLYSIFGTKEKRTTDFLPNNFPSTNVETKNLSTNFAFLKDVKKVFEPIVENTTAKKAELKKQQQADLLNKAQELAENKARLEKIVEELKTKELAEKQKLLTAQTAKQQAQQELKQAAQIAETKTNELESAEQTEEIREKITLDLLEAEKQAIEKEQELTKKQAKLETLAEAARQAEINAKEHLEDLKARELKEQQKTKREEKIKKIQQQQVLEIQQRETARQEKENKARLEKKVEELKIKELEEKQAQQELEQATENARTKTMELKAAEQNTIDLQTKTTELIKSEQHATKNAHELAQTQAELNAQAESAKQAEINAKAQLEKAERAEQELIAKLKEAQQAEEKTRVEELHAQALKKQEEQNELDTLTKQIAKELAQQEFKQFTEEQQRIIEQEQAIEKNIQNLDAEIKLLEKEQQQALQEQQHAKTVQEQTIAQQKEHAARAKQEQAQRDDTDLENFKHAEEQKLIALKQHHAQITEQKELEHRAEIEKELITVKQHIAEIHHDIEQRQAQHLAELEAQHEQEFHEALQEELRLSEQQKQAKLAAEQQKQRIKEAELEAKQQELASLLEQEKNILHEKIASELKSQQELEQQLQQTIDELNTIKTLKTTKKNETLLMQNQLQSEAQALQQHLNQVHNELERAEKEFVIAAQESEKIKFELMHSQQNENENNKPEDLIKMESQKEERLGEEGDDEKKEQTVEIQKQEELILAPKQSVTASPLPTLPPITTTEIPHITPTQNIIHLTPSTPSPNKSTKTQPITSGSQKPSLPFKSPTQQTLAPFPYAPGYQGQLPIGQPTGWPRGTTKIGKTTASRNTNKKTQPYTPPRYGDIWLDTRTPESSPAYSGSSYSAYPEPDSHEQPTTEAMPTQPSITITQQARPIKQTTPTVIEEVKEEPTETPEEITPIDTKKSLPIPEKKIEPKKPTPHWLWWLLFWIKKQFMIFTSYIKNIFT